jgi:hypothetical protein
MAVRPGYVYVSTRIPNSITAFIHRRALEAKATVREWAPTIIADFVQAKPWVSGPLPIVVPEGRMREEDGWGQINIEVTAELGAAFDEALADANHRGLSVTRISRSTFAYSGLLWWLAMRSGIEGLSASDPKATVAGITAAVGFPDPHYVPPVSRKRKSRLVHTSHTRGDPDSVTPPSVTLNGSTVSVPGLLAPAGDGNLVVVRVRPGGGANLVRKLMRMPEVVGVEPDAAILREALRV